ncbi:MAG: hypothetical protein E7588_04220 [Ruminococcaceae bacterium]|nr:hypothetical protein [Oscillospiraceae bacterium]
MKKIPVSIIIDDPAPCVSVYHAHHKTGFTEDGRPVIEYYDNKTMEMFCDIVEKRNIKGKFSVVPMPGNRGDIVNGIDGVEYEKVAEWLDMAKKHLAPRFAIGPEILSHNMAVDISTGKALALREDDWAKEQDRTTLTPYIAHALRLLKEVGIDSCGITSPWRTGIEVEEEYVAAISQAVYQVSGKKNAWYFLRNLRGVKNAKPWIALEEDDRCVVSIPAIAHDRFWETIDTPRNDDEYLNSVVDKLITADGKSGEIVDIINNGSWVILITHWQSLMSNGLMTGMRALDETARRINEFYSDVLEWKSFDEILQMVVSDKQSYPPRVFND